MSHGKIAYQRHHGLPDPSDGTLVMGGTLALPSVDDVPWHDRCRGNATLVIEQPQGGLLTPLSVLPVNFTDYHARQPQREI